jgi:molybdate transport system substrate-binding protein
VLLQQARQGAPFDVVVFAGDAEMKRLEDAGEVQEGTQHVFASNRLILAVPQGGRSLHRLEELREPAYARIGMGDPDSVPAGRYAEQVLRNSGLWSDLQPRLVFTAHAAQTVEYLQRGEVDAAFLYHTDAVTFPWLDVALEVDPSLHGPIRYTSALVTDAPDPRGGQRFLDLLNGSLGQVVLRKHGFGPPAS